MKFKLLLSLLCAGVLTAGAQGQGFKDGIEYYKADQYGNAKTILERTLNDSSTDKALAYYYLGQIAVHDKDVAAAKNYFDKGIQVNPENGFNYVGLGILALNNNDAKGAKTQFDIAKSKTKKYATLLTAIARAYYNADPVTYAKEVDKSLADAYKANKLAPAIFVLRGDMDLDQNQIGDAAANYENAIYNDPTSAEAYVKYANAYIKVNPSYAIDKLIELNQKVPNSALAQRELAEKYYDNDQWTRAAQQYGVYIKNPNHFKEDEERYVVLLYFGKNYDESYSLATKILSQDPNSFLMHRMMFLNRAAQEQYAEAETLANKFFALPQVGNNRFTSNDYVTYGDVLSELGRDSLAIFEYEKAVEVNPEKSDLLKKVSSAYYGSGNYVKAAEAYQKFIDLGQYSTNDLYVLAGRYMTLAGSLKHGSADKNEAIANANKYIDIVLEKVPDDYRISQRKARILLVANNNEMSEDAANAYERTLQLLDANSENQTKRVDVYREAYNQIGSYYILKKNNEKAKYYYNKMLELDPSNTALRQYIDNLK
jgi:tetratricopeptide (TPR) repeat protein